MTAQTHNDLDLWPRIEQAINAATISRFDAEWCLPTCRRKNCSVTDPGQLDRLYSMFANSVRDAVYAELVCKATSEPDVEARPERPTVLETSDG